MKLTKEKILEVLKRHTYSPAKIIESIATELESLQEDKQI